MSIPDYWVRLKAWYGSGERSSHSCFFYSGCFLLGWLFLLLHGCDGSSTTPNQGDGFGVALLTPGSIADGGWNRGAYDGLLRVKSELGAKISHVETKSPAAFEESFHDYAASGFRVIFGHGFEYQESAARVAAEYPESIFITTSGNTVRSNMAPMVFELEQATYLCGFLAAKLSRSRQLGLVGGMDLPSIRSTFTAFRAGAVAADPQVKVREVFIGNFNDSAAAREATATVTAGGMSEIIFE